MMKPPHWKYRDGGEPFAVGAGTDIRGDRHFRDVELAASDHPAERLDDGRNLLEFELEGREPDDTVLERLSVTVTGKCGP